jgi:UDP-N-acetylmuramate: L-alanyl-gamma-D-glutamyl-meso-diaminopimelate ligase
VTVFTPYTFWIIFSPVTKFDLLTANDIYNQSLDKQRIIVVGDGATLITSIITHVLNFYKRKFDVSLPGQEPLLNPEHAVIIIHGVDQLTDYKHHIAILTGSSSNKDFGVLADATPKGGTLIYPELDSTLKQIGSRERADVQAIAYGRYKYETKDGKTILISSTDEKFPIAFSGDLNMEYLSAAKELLKKIGITSSQFYKAVAAYQPA